MQSNVIFGFIFAAFVMFITLRGELPAYLALLFGDATASKGSISITPGTGPTSSAVASTALTTLSGGIGHA